MKKIALPVRFGFAASGSLIGYFLVLSLVGLHTNVFYSLFNGVITGFAIYEAIKYFHLQEKEHFNYGTGFKAGLITGFVATIVFTIFFSVYSTERAPEFLAQLSTQWFSSYSIFEAIVFFTVAIMGFETTLVLTLSFMQLFKTKRKAG